MNIFHMNNRGQEKARNPACGPWLRAFRGCCLGITFGYSAGISKGNAWYMTNGRDVNPRYCLLVNEDKDQDVDCALALVKVHETMIHALSLL